MIARAARFGPGAGTVSSVSLDDARIFHVNVNCSDLERSRRFYADGLGLVAGAHTAPTTTQPGTAFGLDRARWDAWILLGHRGYDGGAIDLLEWQEPTPTGAPPASLFDRGYQRFGLSVVDLDAAVARVEALGGAAWSAPQTHTLAGGHTVRLLMVNDPDGTAIELIEGTGPQVSFVAVSCVSLERSVSFYRALGFTALARFASSGDDGTHLHLAGAYSMDEVMLAAPGGGDVHLILVGYRTPSPVPAPARPANALGLWRTALLVADLDAACAHLNEVNVTTVSPPVAMSMGPDLPELRFVCFAGPDAEIVELIEQPK